MQRGGDRDARNVARWLWLSKTTPMRLGDGQGIGTLAKRVTPVNFVGNESGKACKSEVESCRVRKVGAVASPHS